MKSCCAALCIVVLCTTREAPFHRRTVTTLTARIHPATVGHADRPPQQHDIGEMMQTDKAATASSICIICMYVRTVIELVSHGEMEKRDKVES